MTKPQICKEIHDLVNLIDGVKFNKKLSIEEELQDLRVFIKYLLLDRESLQRELKAFNRK